jgi:transcriptional regulator with XRE-family HTH domain
VTLSESPSYLDDDLVVLRSERGLQQAEVADRTRGRVSQGTVSRLESGRTVVRLDALYALADALAVHPTELLDP